VSLTKWRGSLVRTGIAGLLAAAALGCKEPYEERPDPTAAVFADFGQRIDAYVKLRDSLASNMGALDETKSQAEIAARATTLATLIQRARDSAKQGDIFTPEFATLAVTLIKTEYKQEIDSVVEQRDDAQEELPNFVPAVNMLYPTTYPLATFPATLLKLLPALPTDKIEYRIVTHYLILRDVEANLIIDVIPNAVP
jgi:O-methyltransferase involved in polyketide biosynthesis